eukprot:3361114-Pleurochrysis_carterae.AAC.4
MVLAQPERLLRLRAQLDNDPVCSPAWCMPNLSVCCASTRRLLTAPCMHPRGACITRASCALARIAW